MVDTNHSGWKYGLIKVCEEEGEDSLLLVELYAMDTPGEYQSYCKARVATVEALRMALADVERDGTNTWFWENGTFEWDAQAGTWNYTYRSQKDESN